MIDQVEPTESDPKKVARNEQALSVHREMMALFMSDATEDMAKARICFEMMHFGLHEEMGFSSFHSYLKAYRIPKTWPYHMATTYRKMYLELNLPEEEWSDIPFNCFQGCIDVLTRNNVHEFLGACRRLDGEALRNHLRQFRSASRDVRPPEVHKKHFKLIEMTPEEAEAAGAYMGRIKGALYEGDDGQLSAVIEYWS